MVHQCWDISFDNWYLESTLHDQGKVKELIESYQDFGMLYEGSFAENTEDKKRRAQSKAAQYQKQQKGGTFLKTSKFGDTEDRILIKANGDLVYLAADLA